jgi:uncharacterized membrane protein
MRNRAAFREYAAGALWVLPAIAALLALAAGAVVSQIDIPAESAWSPIAFQGTVDDARALLIDISALVITTIALVLGLTVVALQLSSTQFSPRLLRNFLRDRPNQIVLSIFVATFAYSAAGLYTVGVSAGARAEDYPRLAVSGALLLLFVSLGAIVYFADHLSHSIQIDAITRRVQQETLRVLALPDAVESDTPQPPAWAVPIPGRRSGYVQAVHPALLLPRATRDGITIRVRPHPGEHVVAGTTLAWMWTASAAQPAPHPDDVQHAVDRGVRIGFERTLEQDVGFGIRQLVDVACKALSPAVNDPYTAIQSIDHLTVIFTDMAQRRLGDTIARDSSGRGTVIVPGRTFEELLSITCGLIRRYGEREPTVLLALLRLLDTCTGVLDDKTPRLTAIADEVALILAQGETEIVQPADVVPVRLAAEALLQRILPQ